MNKETMQKMVIESISRKLGDGYDLSIQKVLKTNEEFDGLFIKQEGTNIAPLIYLDYYYDELEDITAVEAVADKILHEYFRMKEPIPKEFNAGSYMESAYIKESAYVRLINRHLNAELLKDVPHMLFLDDFAAVVYCSVPKIYGNEANYMVNNSILEHSGLSRNALMSIAMENTRQKGGIDLWLMDDLIKEMVPCMEASESPNLMWVLTNHAKMYGAAMALFDDVLKDFAKEHGSFYVIFSSVHEIILVPTLDDSDIDRITEINQEVNFEQLKNEEMLGTKAYFYDKDNGFII